jgi:hypothetical protein
VVVTDGQENASKEFSKARVKKMIQRQQTEYNWQFTFLGADQDAFAEAGGLGIEVVGTANFAKNKVDAAFIGTIKKVGQMRTQRRARGRPSATSSPRKRGRKWNEHQSCLSRLGAARPADRSGLAHRAVLRSGPTRP